MRSPLLPLAACLLIVLVALLLFVDGASPRRDAPKVRSAPTRQAPEPAAEARGALDEPGSTDESANERRTAVLPDGDAPVEPEHPTARVFGRIVDSAEEPVPDFALGLRVVRGAWRDGVVTPTWKRRGWTLHGWRTETDAEGRFRFEVPVPTAEWVSLFGDDDPHATRVSRHFGPAGGRDEPRIVVGDNDLGTFVLSDAGALSGTVTDVSGAPVAGAQVRTETIRSRHMSVSTTAGADGRYLLGHLPPGPLRLHVRADGFESVEELDGGTVRVGATLPGPDVRMERAGTISGVVVDEQGTPVQGVRVQAGAVRTGTSTFATARSDAEGRFVLRLHHDARHALSVRGDERFEDWGGPFDPQTTHDPGAAGVRVELRTKRDLVVQVLAAESNEPIERFAARVETRGGEVFVGRPSYDVSDHPGGLVELKAPSESEADLVVRAPGRVPFEEMVGERAASAEPWTVRLDPAARIEGRVLFDGEPVENARATVRPQKLPKPGVEFDPDDFWGGSYRYDVPAGADHPRELRTDADGRFVADDLAAGTWTVRVDDRRALSLVREGSVLATGEAVDLGELVLLRGATLRCTVLLAEGRSAQGLSYAAGAARFRDERITGEDGTFTVEGLAPGEHTVRIRADGVRLLEDEQRAFEVRGGETREVTIDLRDRLQTDVRVRVNSRGEPVPDAVVFLEDVDGDRLPFEIGRTDARGLAAARAPAPRRVRVVVREEHRVLGRTEPFELVAGSHPPVDVELAVGTLVLAFPDELELPEEASYHLALRPETAETSDEQGWTSYSGATPGPFWSPTGGTWTSTRVEVGRVRAGRYAFRLRTWRDSLGEGRVEFLPELEGALEIRANETLVVDVPPE